MTVVTDKHYVVEVNEGIYIVEVSECYSFTNDIRQASLFENLYEARRMAKKCGGTAKKYVITHEVKSCDTE
ncbi:hypothetical protein BUZ15_14215 [Staphylococcus gallinarum]|uniref:hypothetical protein n=1 Tax=Staphylococcus gallinarum TaxID=1293 RepID=UPI000D1E9353|nr:hypothetical protein [Staphylococcus gallinarum]PTK92421.1 hypothetical protein BUZ03_02600 [Staphylococcus gallinarum]PTL07436.1 hypothetical protein BUZ15_14215 [Staphylococcus gallinarum]RIL23712.1 hypothetical protein BUY97_08705 [Staphylococcus gallinarum]RIL24716.1 hypothetical protein BUY99_01445 [Staphylococcus gallinarum]RIL28901.1 hypothetical protein BUY95_06480 [Staphylococcus gallinarum]